MIAAMSGLGLKGMAGAFDEAVTTGVQRNRTVSEILTDLLQAETAHRHAASIRYRMTAARLPVIKDLDAFTFEGTPINEPLVRQLHGGGFLPNRRNVVLVGGTGTGKTHLAIAITAAVVRAGARGRYSPCRPPPAAASGYALSPTPRREAGSPGRRGGPARRAYRRSSHRPPPR